MYGVGVIHVQSGGDSCEGCSCTESGCNASSM